MSKKNTVDWHELAGRLLEKARKEPPGDFNERCREAKASEEKFKKEHPDRWERLYGNESARVLLGELEKNYVPAALEGIEKVVSKRFEESVRSVNKALRRDLQEPALKLFKIAKSLYRKGMTVEEIQRHDDYLKALLNVAMATSILDMAFLGFLPTTRALRRLPPDATAERAMEATSEAAKESLFNQAYLISTITPLTPEPDWGATPTDLARTWIGRWLRELDLTKGQGRPTKEAPPMDENFIAKVLGLVTDNSEETP